MKSLIMVVLGVLLCLSILLVDIKTAQALSDTDNYIGCYEDTDDVGVCEDNFKDGDSLTIENCIQYCRRLDHPHAALYAGNQCWCGELISQSSIAPNSECNTPCSGNANQKCGGEFAVSVFKTVQTWTCPNGWAEYGTSCYYIGMERVSWETARQSCVRFGADLATDKNVNTHDFIKGVVKNMNTAGCNPIWDCNVWFGLHYSQSTGYKWVDGTSLQGGFTPWNPGEPNGSPSSNWCLEYEVKSGGVMWNDHGCPTHRRYICEKIMPPKIPVPTLTCPNGWTEYAKSCYYIGMERVSWETARQSCVRFGADLATDKNVNTHDFIKGVVKNMNTAGCNPIWDCNVWFGLHYSQSTGYKWVDGTSLQGGFTPWNPGEPNGSPSSNWCLEYEIKSGGVMWNDHGCPTHRRYICEKILQ
ncbi:macrophage mannose receptor 1-like [Glandiceps talaboti]